MSRIIEENLHLMKKIQHAEPSVSHHTHEEHASKMKKLKEIVQYKSLRQSMISTVRNYFSGFDDLKPESKHRSSSMSRKSTKKANKKRIKNEEVP